MGLGSAEIVSLAEARDKAHAARKIRRAGQNPIEAKRKAAASETGRPTFGQVADALIEAKASKWRNAKHREQWKIALGTNAAPLRSRRIDEIDTAAILAVLKPMWMEKPETASRLRGRIEAVLDAAKAQGHRSGENPAVWRGHLVHLLPKRGKLARSHHAAMAYQDVPEFIGHLRQCEGIAALALEFTILTAARSGEVYGARWIEFDLRGNTWIVPAERTKAGREHRVPLSDRAAEIVKGLFKFRTCDLVFPSPRGGKPLSHVAMANALRRMKVGRATVHGFRSAFRDWAGNETNFARELAEAGLAHVVGDKAEQAYRRSDALEKRRMMMEAWAQWVEGTHRSGF